MHSIWKRVRGPFHRISCQDHSWETYDIQNSGCLKCGEHHECSSDLGTNRCPLVSTDEGGLCCSITGYCLPTLNLSDQEYVEHVHFSRPVESAHIPPLQIDEIQSIVTWFIMGTKSCKCKSDEISKILAKYQYAFVKTLKQNKLRKEGDKSIKWHCIVTAISQALFQVKPKLIQGATHELCSFCSTHIYKCLKSIRLNNVQNRKVNIIIGMLYLMKQGLVIQNIQWLPRVEKLNQCLPHETNLEKTFQLCMKLVCETENEIKLALRQRIHLT